MRHLLFSAALAAALLVSACGNPATPEGDFSRTVILISTDGTHPAMVARAHTPILDRLASEGRSAPEGMIPVFPTKTFPNHYAIVTGLYPAEHGIVGNSMYDPERDATFTIRDRAAVEDPAWWTGEPIWTTAERNGIRSATYFWVGSESPYDGIRPSYWYPYDSSVSGADRVDQVLSWLDLPRGERPEVITLYFSDVDSEGHRHGPDASEVTRAVEQFDAHMGRLVDGLEARKLMGRIHLIVVSDHGMAGVSPDRIVFLDDYIDLDDVTVVESGPNLAMNVTDGKEEVVFDALVGAHPELSVWKKTDMPERFHFNGNPRIPDINGYVASGWLVVPSREGFRGASGGAHGYDNQEPSMRALFVAHGPSFAPGTTAEPFENIEVHDMLLRILGLETP